MDRFLLSFCLVMCCIGDATADPFVSTPGLLGEHVNLAFGVKMFGGLNVWTDPTDVPIAFAVQDIGFAKARAGAGAGAGLMIEARFIRFIAFETGLLYEWDSIWENLNLSGLEVKFTAEMHTLRMPFLVKGVLPLKGVRLALGIGPEVVVPVSTAGYTDVDLRSIGFTFEAYSETSVMLTMGIDIVPEVVQHLLLPIGIRASYNLTQPAEYADRVELKESGPQKIERLCYQNSWDFRLQIGLAYEL